MWLRGLLLTVSKYQIEIYSTKKLSKNFFFLYVFINIITFQALIGAMDHWVAAFPRDFAHKEFLDKFNEICHIVGQLNTVSKKQKKLRLSSGVAGRRNVVVCPF